MVYWLKDLGRSIRLLRDTAKKRLTTRKWVTTELAGGHMGAIVPALDDRLKVSVLLAGGLNLQRP